MSVRSEYDQKLVELKHELIRMASLVEEVLAGGMRALVARDADMAQRVIDSDDEVDDLQMDIEDQCITLIATQQPLAKDLRAIFAAIKMSTDLERIADYGVGVARVAVQMKDEEYVKPLVDLPRMTYIACAMLRTSVRAFTESSEALATEAASHDAEMDALFKQVYRELLTYVLESPKNINQMISFVLIARYLERVGDHITNVCEWIVFNATGKRVDLGHQS
jgi:phosphate transport system protein